MFFSNWSWRFLVWGLCYRDWFWIEIIPSGKGSGFYLWWSFPCKTSSEKHQERSGLLWQGPIYFNIFFNRFLAPNEYSGFEWNFTYVLLLLLCPQYRFRLYYSFQHINTRCTAFPLILSNVHIVYFCFYLSSILPQGESLLKNMKESSCTPHFGDISVDMNILKGVSCVGALPYLQNFNMRFRPSDSRKLIIQITKLLREPDVSECFSIHKRVDLFIFHVY